MFLLSTGISKSLFSFFDRFYSLIWADRNDKIHVTALVLAFLTYVVAWSQMTISRIYALHAGVYDLGLFMEELWLMFHSNFTFTNLLIGVLTHGFSLLISPLSLLGSYQALVIFQSTWIGIAVFPIYGISRRFLQSNSLSLLISLSFLFYFPLAGVNWFDVHNQAFFPTLFLFAYYFFLTNKYRISTVFFVLSGLSKYPFFIFPLLLAVTLVVERVVPPVINHHKIKLDHGTKFITIIGLSSAFLLVITDMLLSLTHFAMPQTTQTNSSYLFKYIDYKIYTLFLIFGPVLFLPLLSKRWLLLTLPYIYLLFSSSGPYAFSSFGHYQYTSALVPFIYLGTIEGIHKLNRYVSHSNGADSSTTKMFYRIKPVKLSTKMVVTMFVIIGMLALVYEPYGPLNNYTASSFGLGEIEASNISHYQQLVRMASMIPANDPYVVMGDSIIQSIPRGVPPNAQNLMVLPYALAYNLTYQSSNGHTWTKAQIDYVLASQYAPTFYLTAPFPYNLSMFGLLKELTNNNHYGVLAEASGQILLKNGYTGPVEYFVPFEHTYPSSVMYNAVEHTISAEKLITVNDPINQNLWYGPYAYLSPGTYQVSFQIRVSNVSASDHLTLSIVSDYGSDVLASKLVLGQSFQHAEEWQNISMTVTLLGVYQHIEFTGLNASWNGSVSLKQVSVNQVGAPNNNNVQ